MTVRRVMITWLALIALSFVVGAVVIATVPALPTVSIGVVTNVAMAVSVGAVLSWMGRWRSLAAFALAGAVVTVLGVDGLALTSPGGAFLGVLAFDVIAVVVAVIGMSLLLTLGAIGGEIARGLDSRCHCLRHWLSARQRVRKISGAWL